MVSIASRLRRWWSGSAAESATDGSAGSAASSGALPQFSVASSAGGSGAGGASAALGAGGARGADGGSGGDCGDGGDDGDDWEQFDAYGFAGSTAGPDALTDAFLARRASVRGEMLDVEGGVVHGVVLEDAERPRDVELWVVALTRTKAVDDSDQELVVTLVDDEGQRGEVYRSRQCGHRFYAVPLRFSVTGQEFDLSVEVEINGTGVAIPLPVRNAKQPAP